MLQSTVGLRSARGKNNILKRENHKNIVVSLDIWKLSVPKSLHINSERRVTIIVIIETKKKRKKKVSTYFK